MLFPLRLTPFEEYMLLDDQPAYPMSCFFMIELRGKFNVSVFESALQQALERHHLLTCSVTESKGNFYWHNAGKVPKIVRKPLDEELTFPASGGIDLFHEPALKVTICNEKISPADIELAGQTNIIFEFHHSAGDAAGAARFVEDILCYYARQKGFADAQRDPVEPDLLIRRGQFRWGTFGQRNLLKQLWGFTRAWMFLMNRVIPLTTKKPVDYSKPPVDFPAILRKNLSVAETQTILQKAKQFGITINDHFLCTTFLAMKHWQTDGEAADSAAVCRLKSSGCLRIAVPTDLRTAAEERMPAANIVSMVFLDRKPKNIEPTQSFFQGIHREMQHIKQCNLGWAFIHGLTLYRRIFGNFRKMMPPNRCWATATVTNLGRLFAEVPLPRREGRVQVDDSLELAGIETSPPVRAGTALGISVMTYADCMTINLHYDSSVLTRSEALTILEML